MDIVITKLGLESVGVRKANNAGMVNINAAVTSFTLHTMPTQVPTTCKVRKVLVFPNNVGGNTFLRLGYTNLAAAFVQTVPDLLCINNIENVWTEADLPNIEWRPDTTLLTGTLGDIIAQVSVCAANQVRVLLEVEEIGKLG